MTDTAYPDLALAVLAIPFAGTTLGAACVFLLRRDIPELLERVLMGFAAGVMTAASVWSLLIPAIDLSAGSGMAKVTPAAAGFVFGMVFLLLLDKVTPHQHMHSSESEGPRTRLSISSKLALAVTIHNIPEGIAIGITLAGALWFTAFYLVCREKSKKQLTNS